MKNFTPKFITNFKSSGLLTGIVIGAVAVFTIQKITFNQKMAASLLPGNAPTVCGLSQMPGTSPTYGIILSESEASSAITSYQQSHPATDGSVTWGGMIGKTQMIAIINSLGTSEELKYKFITNSGNNKTAIIFQGGNTNPVSGEPSSGTLYIRSGSASDAFCPPKCN